MSSLSSVEAKLPPGFRFHPRDEELICDYLMKWTMGSVHTFPLLIEVDLNKCEPWDIPETACVGGKEWYFYSQRDRKYATGLRTNRATVSGYWKATGKDRPITRKGNLVGMRKTLVFYQGRAPKGRKSDWVMHEFRLERPGPKTLAPVKEDWVLCRVFFKSRSEVPEKSEDQTGNCYDFTPSSPSSLPPLMEPFITFDQTTQACEGDHHQYHHEQVPCFSMFNVTSQTNPTFSLITSHMDPPQILQPTKILPNFGGGTIIPHLNYNNSQHHLNYNNCGNDVISSNPSSDCDKKVIKAVLNHLTKMESTANDGLSCSMKGYSSPSFGERSSDSYLSEVGLSSLWSNQYS